MKNNNPVLEQTLRAMIEVVSRYAFWFIFVIYASGFLIWNVYLSKYGFFEYNLIQIRYVSAGIFLWLPSFALILIAAWLTFNYRDSKWQGDWVPNILAGLAGGWLVLAFVVFPYTPQYLGGAKPIATTILGNPDQIRYLNNFQIPSADNASGTPSVQTAPVCLLYQNDKYAVFFNAANINTTSNGVAFNMRVLSLDRENFSGFQAVSGGYGETQCNLAVAAANSYIQLSNGLAPVSCESGTE